MLEFDKKTRLHLLVQKVINQQNSFVSKIGHYYQDSASRAYSKKYKVGNLPEFVAIETCTECNNNCSFCPQSRKPRHKEYMAESIFERIMEKLTESDFQGTLLFNINNEPLIDNRLERFIEFSRERGFNGGIGFFTNGLLLSEDRLYSLLSIGVNDIAINSYSDTGDKIVGKISEWIESPEKIAKLTQKFPKARLRLIYRSKKNLLDNRGGDAPNKGTFTYRRAPCHFPFDSLNITTDGSLIQCCYDFYCKTKFAHIEENNLAELWHHKYISNTREKLLIPDRSTLPLCSQCDYKGYNGRVPFGIYRFIPL